MSTVKFRLTWIAEYEGDPAHYEDCDGDPVKMAAYDQQGIDEGALDPVELLDNTVSIVIEPA